MKSKAQKCEVCNKHFIPDYRIGENQKVCTNLRCKKERKRRAQENWVKINPNYFKGRYPELKEKIKTRSDSLKDCKQRQDNYTKNDKRNIQDEISINKNKLLTIFTEFVNIQDEISYKLTNFKQQFYEIANDIQDKSNTC